MMKAQEIVWLVPPGLDKALCWPRLVPAADLRQCGPMLFISLLLLTWCGKIHIMIHEYYSLVGKGQEYIEDTHQRFSSFKTGVTEV